LHELIKNVLKTNKRYDILLMYNDMIICDL
jgi:hypothetical protein